MKKRHIFISLILAGLLLVLPGCIDSGVEGGPDSFITADPTVINSGETSTITAFVMTTAGTPMPDGSLVRFEATTVDGDIHIKEAAKTVGGRAAFDLTVTLPAGAPNIEVIITATVADVTLRTTLPVIAVPLPLDVIPDTQTITNPAGGETAVYTISGGTAPHTVSSDNPGLVTVGVVDNKLTATVVGVPTTSTTVTITVLDSAGITTTASLILDVPPLLPLAVTPTAQTITNPAGGETAVYTISGGTAPHTVSSDNPGLVTVGVVDNKLTATVVGVPTTSTTVTITVLDSAGITATASLILDVPPLLPLAVMPQTATVFGIANPDNDTSDDVTFFISGGIPDYFVTSNTPGVIAHPDALGEGITSFTVDPDAVTMETPVILTVMDSVGTITIVTVTVKPVPLSVVPGTQTITNPAVGGSATYTISGGTGPFMAFSDNPGLVTVPEGTFAGPTLTATVEGVPTEDATVTITIYDAAGSSITASLILDVPPLLPLAVTPSTATVTGIANPDNDISDDVTFFISGGIPDYSVTSNTPGVITSPGTLGAGITSFTVDPDAVTTSTVVTLTVVDAAGTSMEVTVAVEPFVSVTLTATPSEITVLGTSSIAASVLDGEGHPVPDGTSVSFSQRPELGEIIPLATTYRGVATATFRASNIPGTVVITGTVGDASNTVDIPISAAATGSIKFVSATPDVIAIRGSGGDETSLISFLVRDINGNPVVDGTLIDFVMHGPSGGRVPADGGEFIGERDDTPTKARVSTLNGVASIHLNSGSVAGTVLIIATVDVAGITLSSASAPISVGGGVPSEKRLTVTTDRFNLTGFGWAGREATISVYLADRFGNYNVLEGTSVSFYAESGAIDRSAVADATGRTSVTFRTQLPNPVDVDPEAWEIELQGRLPAEYGISTTAHPRDGWATIMVSVRGEEAFDDADADGIFDEGESFTDTPEAFIDVDDNELRDTVPFEIFIDDDGDRTFDMRNDEWDFDKTIFKNIPLLITGRPHYFKVRPNDINNITDPPTFNIPNGEHECFRVLIADRNLNHLSGGTTVSISSDEGTLAGTTSFTFPDAFTYGPKEFLFTLSDDCPDLRLRPTTITITVIHEGIAYFQTITGDIN
ncbi:hypothetical protein M1N10_05175 [Thermodesulfovibrionales bacterium]|nr:hypothetical protein [Thermodesulfovibrionales bacterium]